MRLIDHPDVWAATIEGDTLTARTDLDLGANYPENTSEPICLRAAQNELRQKNYQRVFLFSTANRVVGFK